MQNETMKPIEWNEYFLEIARTVAKRSNCLRAQVGAVIEFSKQEYWSRLPCPSPGDLPDPGIEPVSLMSPALAGRFFTTSATWEDGIYFSTDTLQGGTVTCSPLVIS